MEVTLRDIAEELDISAMTVSLSLRHDPSVSPATRARVHEVARRMGYKPRRGRPRRVIETDTRASSLGLLLRHESLEAAQRDATMMKLMAGIMSVTNALGMQLKMDALPTHTQQYLDEDPSLLPSMLQEGGCHAVILQGAHDERNVEFLSRRLPAVSIGRIYSSVGTNAVIADNVEGVFRLVTHLVELGHRRLAWVGPHYTSSFVEERKTGFVKGCFTHNLEFDRQSFFGRELYLGDAPVSSIHDIRDRNALLAAVESGVTGFVCANDRVAYSTIAVLEADGKRIPEDVSVTGFDASFPSIPGSWNWRNLTGVDPEFFEIGKMAARQALQRVAYPSDKPCVLSVRGEIVVGDSTGPVAGA